MLITNQLEVSVDVILGRWYNSHQDSRWVEFLLVVSECKCRAMWTIKSQGSAVLPIAA